MIGGEGQEREMPRPFDGEREFALVPRAGADFAAGANLAAIGEIAAQLIAVLVINNFGFVFAVDADPAGGGRKTASAALAARAPVARTAI